MGDDRVPGAARSREWGFRLSWRISRPRRNSPGTGHDSPSPLAGQRPPGSRIRKKTPRWIIDGNSGRVLYSETPMNLATPASLTKMMTLYLLFEQLRSGQMTLATPMTISEHAAIQAPTKLHVRPGNIVPSRHHRCAGGALGQRHRGCHRRGHRGFRRTIRRDDDRQGARARHGAHLLLHMLRACPTKARSRRLAIWPFWPGISAYDFPQYFHYFSTPAFTYRGEMHVDPRQSAREL